MPKRNGGTAKTPAPKLRRVRVGWEASEPSGIDRETICSELETARPPCDAAAIRQSGKTKEYVVLFGFLGVVMSDIRLGQWVSIESGMNAFCVKVDESHVWYSLEKGGHVSPVIRSLWLETMKFAK